MTDDIKIDESKFATAEGAAKEIYIGVFETLKAWMSYGGFPEERMLDHNPIAMLLLRQTLNQMVEDDLVFKDGHGAYLINERGLELLEKLRT